MAPNLKTKEIDKPLADAAHLAPRTLWLTLHEQKQQVEDDMHARAPPYFGDMDAVNDGLYQKKFLQLLASRGLPAQFAQFMLDSECVISGSTVFDFLHADLRIDDVTGSANDVDLYVKKDHLFDTVEYLRNLQDSDTTVSVEEDTNQSGTNHQGVLDHRRLKLCRDGNCHFIDVIESMERSSLYPICLFNFTHCRNALSPNGLLLFHPSWTLNLKSVVHFEDPAITQELPRVPIPNQETIDKYVGRGFTVSVYDAAQNPPHQCMVSFECPITVRRTDDNGTWFVPFHNDAKLTGKSSVAGRNSCCLFRHGGVFCLNPDIVKMERALVLEPSDNN